jgi:hypothetical protein
VCLLKRTARTAASLAATITVFSVLTTGCQSDAPATEPAANAPTAESDKRWADFQKTNQRDMATGMSAYQKRQEQLAKERAGKSGASDAAKPAPSTPPAPSNPEAPASGETGKAKSQN